MEPLYSPTQVSYHHITTPSLLNTTQKSLYVLSETAHWSELTPPKSQLPTSLNNNNPPNNNASRLHPTIIHTITMHPILHPTISIQNLRLFSDSKEHSKSNINTLVQRTATFLCREPWTRTEDLRFRPVVVIYGAVFPLEDA